MEQTIGSSHYPSPDEKSTNLQIIEMRDIVIPAGGKPLLERKMRLRRLNVFPGGLIPLHDHTNRPAILYCVSGSFTVHNSTSNVPQVINAGDAVSEFGHLQHWAKNNSDKESLTVLTFDLLDDGAASKMEPCPICEAQQADKDAAAKG